MERHEFTYFISERNYISVVSLMGKLDKLALPAFTNILDDISIRCPRFVIFNCHDLSGLDPNLSSAFSELLACVRGLSMEVCLCFIEPKLKDQLVAEKVVQPMEIHDNLFSAVGSCLQKTKKAS